MINKGYHTSGRTSESDECLTPRYGVEPIVKHLKNKGYKHIWCPFDKEDSQYVRVLKTAGFDVIASHIEEGGDFFFGEPDSYDCIVSNPPFSKKDAILRRCYYELKKPFALLLPQNCLQSMVRTRMFMDKGVEYLGFNKRICFYTSGDLTGWKPSNHFASGYFCKDVLPKPLCFEELSPIQEAYK